MRNEWQTKKLGELSEIQLGKTPARANSAFWDEKRETDNVWLSIADLLNVKDNLAIDSREYLSDKGAAISKIVRKGTLLVSFKLTLGRLAFAGRDLYTNEAIAALPLFHDREMAKEFLFYFLHFFDWVKASENDIKLKGMTLNKAKLRELQVHFPPLPEQQRIVGILDEAFDSIATVKADAQKNFQNARALFESHLQAVFIQHGKDWAKKRLGDLATFRNGINFTKSSHGESVKIVGVKDFQNNYWAPLDKLDTVTTDGELPESDTLKENDILFVRSNGNMELIGRSLLVGAIADRTTHSGFTIRARLESGGIMPNYLCHFLKSTKTRREMIDSGIGTNIKSLNQGTLAALVVPVPSIVDQVLIGNQLEALSTETQRLESIYQQKLAALDALNKSLLQQAFSGQL